MSDTAKRVIVGIIGIPLIIMLIYLGGYFLFVLTVLLQTLCLWELLTIFGNKKYYPLKYTTIIFSVIMLVTAVYKVYFFIPFFIFSVLFFISVEIFRGEKHSPLNTALSLFGLLYITLPFIMLNSLGKNFYLVLSIFIMIWSCDTFAYFGGKIIGKHKLTVISPKKTIEGSLTGFVFTMITALILYNYSDSSFTLKDFLVSGIIVGIISQLGDIFESLLKRYCEVKDSSNIIPGHGGVLDRFDSLIFALPLIYVYLNYFK